MILKKNLNTNVSKLIQSNRVEFPCKMKCNGHYDLQKCPQGTYQDGTNCKIFVSE